jgi:hypothetical protein
MAFAVAHPTISQSAKLTSNASIIAFLPIQISRTQAPNAPHGTKVPADDWGQFKVVRCIITAAEKEYPQIELTPTYRSEDEKPTGKPADFVGIYPQLGLSLSYSGGGGGPGEPWFDAAREIKAKIKASRVGVTARFRYGRNRSSA